MSHHEDWEIAIKLMAIALNRNFWEGDANKQRYTKGDLLNLAFGLPKNDPVANVYFNSVLEEWRKKGFLKLIELEGKTLIEIVNPSFPGI
jgi:hypothetical protein